MAFLFISFIKLKLGCTKERQFRRLTVTLRRRVETLAPTTGKLVQWVHRGA